MVRYRGYFYKHFEICTCARAISHYPTIFYTETNPTKTLQNPEMHHL